MEQVAALPPRERTLFEQLFHELNAHIQKPQVSPIEKWPDFGQRIRSIYGDKIAPDSQEIIHEARGDR
jgi:hypothetical protein